MGNDTLPFSTLPVTARTIEKAQSYKDKHTISKEKKIIYRKVLFSQQKYAKNKGNEHNIKGVFTLAFANYILEKELFSQGRGGRVAEGNGLLNRHSV